MRGETIALRRSHECHDRHPRLLRPGSERPRSRRTAEKRDEFPPFHYPMPHVLPTERIAHSVVQETYCAARFGEGLWQLRVIHVIPAIPACPVRLKSGIRPVPRLRVLAPGSSFFPQQRLQRAAQQLAQGGGDSLPVAGLAVLEFAKTLHQIEELAVNLNRIHRRPALKPLAPAPSVVCATLPPGGNFLDEHGHRFPRNFCLIRVLLN